MGTHPYAEVYLLAYYVGISHKLVSLLGTVEVNVLVDWCSWSPGIQGDGPRLSSRGHLEGTWPLLFLQDQQGVFSLQEEEGAKESRLCKKIEGDILTLMEPFDKICTQVPRNSQGGLLDDNLEDGGEEEDRNKKSAGVSEGKKTAGLKVKKSSKKGNK